MLARGSKGLPPPLPYREASFSSSVGSETENSNVGGIENQKIKRFNFHGWDAKLKCQTEIGTFKVHRFY